MMVATEQHPGYTAASIRVLKGLEPIKERPGMYTKTSCPTHACVQEVIDNAADEALAGHATRIDVTIFKDGSAMVVDNGRGIPVEMHPTEKRPAIELIFSKLHAGGKFNKQEGGSSYKFSGGLHGVGVSVTNALSSRLEVEVMREGGLHRIVFSNGNTAEKLARIGDATTTGTRVRAWPNQKYFDSPKFNISQIEHLLRSKAVLLPGLTTSLTIEGEPEKAWQFPDGMAEYLMELCRDEPAVPIFSGEKYITEENGFSLGEGASWAIAWLEDGSSKSESYVNLIPTPDGGTHEAGLKSGITEAVRSFIDHHSLLPRGIKITADDVTGKLVFLLSTRMLDPQFQGQTKGKLTSRDGVKLVLQSIRDPLELWLNANVEFAKRIAELAIKAASSRQKSAQKTEKRKSSGLATLPGKLTDCASTDTSRNEIFLVEGDSAGGSGKQGRDKEYQAILPLRGKVLNSWEIERGQLFANNEIHDISVATGVDPHGIEDIDSVDLSNLRYGKISILSDADYDGSHIQVLLLTLFVRHFPALITHGHIYVSQPPLYKVAGEWRGKVRKIYCLDEAERDQAIEKMTDEGCSPAKITVSRFKGLGEMNPEQLWETTLCPDTRRLVQFTANNQEIHEMSNTFNLLMSKGCPGGRRAWMEKEGNLVEADI